MQKEKEIPKPKKVRNNMLTQNLRYKEEDGKNENTKSKEVRGKNLRMQGARKEVKRR